MDNGHNGAKRHTKIMVQSDVIDECHHGLLFAANVNQTFLCLKKGIIPARRDVLCVCIVYGGIEAQF